MIRRLGFLFLICLFCAPSGAQTRTTGSDSGLPVPRFMTLKFDSVNGRAGPSTEHPIAWHYKRVGLPIEVIGETQNWRRIRDPEGEEVWMHERTLSGRRSVWVKSPTWLRTRPDADAPQEALAEPGAILWLERCLSGWCRLEVEGQRGWAQARDLWGVYHHELGTAPSLSENQAHATGPSL